MYLTIRLFGFEWLSVELVRAEDLVDLAPCVACEDSGDDCAVCGVEEVEA